MSQRGGYSKVTTAADYFLLNNTIMRDFSILILSVYYFFFFIWVKRYPLLFIYILIEYNHVHYNINEKKVHEHHVESKPEHETHN